MERPWLAHYPPGLPARGRYPDVPLWHFLREGADRWPAKPAVIDGEATWTYRDLWRRSLAVAGALRARGIGPGDRVALRLPSGVSFVTTHFGTLLAGATVIPLSPDAGEEERTAQIEETTPALVVDAPDTVEPGETVEPLAEETAVLQLTSGTTGRPRAAIMSQFNLVANAHQNVRWFDWGEDEVNLAVLPFHHTWGLCVGLHSTIVRGGTLVTTEGFEPERVFDLVERHGVTVLYGSATMFHRLADAGAGATERLRSLRHVKAGAMLSQGDLKARWDALFPHAPLQQGYGLTEASPECHNNPPHRHRPGTVGVPIQDTDCRIVDPEDPTRVLAAGEVGEVCLRGPQVTKGYWNRPDETATTIVDGWLRTGDLGSLDDEGYLTIVDRLKDILKFRGWTVVPNVVEECLLRHPAVAEAVVVGRRDDRDGDVPTAFVVLRGEAGEGSLRAHCEDRLARYEVPRRVLAVEEIPKNRVGKPLRRVLRDRLHQAFD